VLNLLFFYANETLRALIYILFVRQQNLVKVDCVMICLTWATEKFHLNRHYQICREDVRFFHPVRHLHEHPLLFHRS